VARNWSGHAMAAMQGRTGWHPGLSVTLALPVALANFSKLRKFSKLPKFGMRRIPVLEISRSGNKCQFFRKPHLRPFYSLPNLANSNFVYIYTYPPLLASAKWPTVQSSCARIYLHSPAAYRGPLGSKIHHHASAVSSAKSV